MKLDGKTVLVTGGSKGIGRACVEAFAKDGANVIINYAHDEKAAQEVADEVSKLGVKTLIVKADIGKKSEVADMFSKIKKEFSSIDVLVNNAGIAVHGEPENFSLTELAFETNTLGTIRVTNEAISIMDEGKIVFVSSIHGQMGHGRPNVIAYSASKAALESYTKNLARHLAPKILVNAIEPGRTLTPGWGKMTEDYKKEQASGQLINRWIKSSEIADGVIFLVKNDAVCGEVLVIDGGMGLKSF